jgi:hypothetical protein
MPFLHRHAAELSACIVLGLITFSAAAFGRDRADAGRCHGRPVGTTRGLGASARSGPDARNQDRGSAVGNRMLHYG